MAHVKLCHSIDSLRGKDEDMLIAMDTEEIVQAMLEKYDRGGW